KAFVERFDIDVDGVLAERQSAGDLFLAFAGQQKLQRLLQARRQWRERSGRAVWLSRKDALHASSQEAAEVRDQLALAGDAVVGFWYGGGSGAQQGGEVGNSVVF